MKTASLSFAFGIFGFVAGCSGATVDVGALDGGSSLSTVDSGNPGNTSSNDGGASDGSTSTDGSSITPSGPQYEVHLRATQTPVTFSDGYSGETPSDQRMAVRKLTLLRNASDTSPLVVFDNGANAVVCGLNDGNDTVAGTVTASTLPADTFTIARVGVGYYDFTVAATLHTSGMALPGSYHDIEVLTDGTNYQGTPEAKGWYSFSFIVAGTTYGPQVGTGLVTPVDNTSGGLTLDTTGNETDYVFPVNLTINPAITSTAKVVFTINTYQDFRWQDQTMAGYTAGVFDTTTTTFEPVMSFGANSFTISLE